LGVRVFMPFSIKFMRENCEIKRMNAIKGRFNDFREVIEIE